MSDAVRGLMVLMSVVLWLPSLRPLIDGRLTIEEGVLRYVAALGISWAGCAGLTALVRSYTPEETPADGAEPEPDDRSREMGRGHAEEKPDHPLRRTEDATAE